MELRTRLVFWPPPSLRAHLHAQHVDARLFLLRTITQENKPTTTLNCFDVQAKLNKYWKQQNTAELNARCVWKVIYFGFLSSNKFLGRCDIDILDQQCYWRTSKQYYDIGNSNCGIDLFWRKIIHESEYEYKASLLFTHYVLRSLMKSFNISIITS